MNDLIFTASLLKSDADEIRKWAERLSELATRATETLESGSPDADEAERAVFEGLNVLDSIQRVIIRNAVGHTRRLATYAYSKGVKASWNKE